MSTSSRQGMRSFMCDECGHDWIEASRDCLSPSIETCPKCRADVHPGACELRPDWPLDSMGNLLQGHDYLRVGKSTGRHNQGEGGYD